VNQPEGQGNKSAAALEVNLLTSSLSIFKQNKLLPNSH